MESKQNSSKNCDLQQVLIAKKGLHDESVTH